ncbi:triosephosphate isomerase [Thioflavicoccus mobilis 8321]|uniref:Triosephosphate isomerase n=1 Tax=Thioflavicoccus mobilis 8321 TaxID=765912 RepID=L0GVU6_9GAMM|nr:triose-phosphate isomerase [Thioflavicoccus mobilis]AGA89429.1 triosephosphate isomerase [Thioflavicoccus mobilis 8321]
MRKPLVAGNWKMNGSRASVTDLLGGIRAGIGEIPKAEVAVCPPFPFLQMTEEALRGSSIAWGAQNLCTEPAGAFTGEVAGSMIREFGCTYVIVGHSERREYYGEDNQVVARKEAMARERGLVPILCVGETLAQREAGITSEVVADQLDAVLELSGVSAFGKTVIAYEPVWAIGTGLTATPEQAQEVHAFIRGRIAEQSADVAAGVRILYGGSMKPDNAADLMAQPDIDGGLIGGASLKPNDFLAICAAAHASC